MTTTPSRPTRALALVTALALLTGGLAGCIGTDGGDADVEPASTSTTTEAPAPTDETAAFQGSPTREVLWRNGSFGAEENQFPGQVDGSWIRAIDITDKVPEGELVRLNATLDFPRDATERVFDNMEVELSAPEETVLQARNTDRTIPQYLTAALLHQGDGPIEIEVRNQWPTASPETPYTLRIEVAVTPSTVPARVPTQIEVPDEAAAIEVRPAEDTSKLSAMAWGPDDGYLGWHTADDAPPARVPVADAGSHVVRTDAPAHLQLVDADGAPLEPDQPLEPLPLTTTLGGGHVLATGSGPDTWTTNVSKAPIGVSFQVQPAGPGDSGLIAGSDIRVQIATKNGTVMDEPFFFPVNPFAGDGPLFLDGLTGFPRSFADENTTDGEWTWTAQYDLAADAEIVPVWVHYERGGS